MSPAQLRRAQRALIALAAALPTSFAAFLTWFQTTWTALPIGVVVIGSVLTTWGARSLHTHLPVPDDSATRGRRWVLTLTLLPLLALVQSGLGIIAFLTLRGPSDAPLLFIVLVPLIDLIRLMLSAMMLHDLTLHSSTERPRAIAVTFRSFARTLLIVTAFTLLIGSGIWLIFMPFGCIFYAVATIAVLLDMRRAERA